MNFKEFILNMISSSNSTVNSKIVAGFITLFATIAFGAFTLLGAMGITATLTGAFFGLSSLDYKTQLDTDHKSIDPDTGNTPVNP